MTQRRCPLRSRLPSLPSHLRVYLCSLRFLFFFFLSLLSQDLWVVGFFYYFFSTSPPTPPPVFSSVLSLARAFVFVSAGEKKKKSFPCKVGPGRASGERCCPGWHGRQPQSPVLGPAATRPNKSLSPPRDSGGKGGAGVPAVRGCTVPGTAQVAPRRCFPGLGCSPSTVSPPGLCVGPLPPALVVPRGLGRASPFVCAQVCLCLPGWNGEGVSLVFVSHFCASSIPALCPWEGIPFPKATFAFSGISASPGEKGQSWPGAAAACVPAQGLLCGLGRLLGRCSVSCHHLRCHLPDANSRIWPLVYRQE